MSSEITEAELHQLFTDGQAEDELHHFFTDSQAEGELHQLFTDSQAEDGNALSDLWLEEADERLIIHVEWAAAEKQCERVIVVSNDTDTLLCFFIICHT